MDYRDATATIKGGHYEPAANFMVKELLGTEGLKLTQVKRGKLTSYVTIKLKTNHQSIYSLQQGDFKPDEIAKQAYVETFFQLAEEFGLESDFKLG